MPSAAPTEGGLDRPVLAAWPYVVLLKPLGYVLGSDGYTDPDWHAPPTRVKSGTPDISTPSGRRLS